MRTILLLFSLSLLVAGLKAAPQLQQGAVVNAASFAVSGAPNAGIAQGSLFTVFGVDLGPTTAVNASQFPLPTNLGGVSVRVSANGQNFDCPLIFVLNSQVSAILPSNVPVGTASLTVTYNGSESNAIPFPVVSRSVGVFSRSSTGAGQAVIQNYISPANQPVNAINASAQPGQIGILWATGLGASLNADDRNAPAPGNLLPLNDIAVYVGGVKAEVQYAGRSGCCSGVDQINFVVPSVVQGCYVPVVAVVNGIASNFTTMSVAANGGTCEGAFGLSTSQLDSLVTKSSIRIGSVGLTRVGIETFGINVSTETGVATFFEVSGNSLIAAGGEVNDTALALNSCTVSTYRVEDNQGGDQEPPDYLDQVKTRGLDAGATIQLSGPNGAKTLPKEANAVGVYYGQLTDPMNPLASYLSAGNYTVSNGAGGADVGGFSFNRSIPTFLNWTNRNAISNVPRNQALTVTWNPGTSTSGYVAITGFSYSVPQKAGSTFFCLADPATGSFAVPAYVLNAMVATDNGGNSPVATGTLSVGGVLVPSFFEAPGLDLGIFSVTGMNTKSVNYQ